MAGEPKWLALGYSIPANPSRIRVYVWRKLREIGAENFKPGVAVLPNSQENLARFEALRQDIRDRGGEAWVLEMNFSDAGDDREMEKRFEESADRECRALLKECGELLSKMEEMPPGQKRSELIAGVRRALSKYEKASMRKEKSQVASELEAGMSELFSTPRSMRGDLSATLARGKEKREKYPRALARGFVLFG